MRKINRILVPTDFSDSSRVAYQYAKAITDFCGGKINLIHIIPILEYYQKSLNDVGYPPSMDQPKAGFEEEIIARMENEILEYFDPGIQGDIIVKLGRKPYSDIVLEAEKDEYDLIVMGKAGSHQTSIIGNITEKVVRHSPKPVLCVNPGLKLQSIKHIVVPTDYSQYSLQALDMAILYALGMNGDITLFHVVESFGSESEDEPMIPEQDVEESVRMKLLNRVETYLENRYGSEISLSWNAHGRNGEFLVNQKGISGNVPFSIIIQRGVGAHYNITDFSNDNADLIIMNTHGRGGLSNLFMGSTTERVMQQSAKPVLSVRAEEEEMALDG